MTIKEPIITEKTVRLAENFNQFTFEVDQRTDKTQASADLAKLFDVEVIDAKVIFRLGKKLNFKRRKGQRRNRKIMIFRLKKGDKIDLFSV